MDVHKLQTISSGIEDVTEEKCAMFESCHFGKHHKASFQKDTKDDRKYEVLELVHTDVKGPLKASHDGRRYMLLFTCQASIFTAIYPMTNKSEVFTHFKNFLAWAERQTGKKIKAIRSDQGTEHVNSNMINYMNDNGISHQQSATYTPQTNGVAERANRIVIEKTKCMIQHSGLSQKFWADVAIAAVYLKNRSPRKSTPMTPYEMFYGKRPYLGHLRVIGCEGWSYVPTQKREGLEAPNAIRCVLIGYELICHTYKLLDLKKGTMFTCRHVDFNETVLSAKQQQALKAPTILELPNMSRPFADAFSDIVEDEDEADNRTE